MSDLQAVQPNLHKGEASARLGQLAAWGTLGQGIYIFSQFLVLVMLARLATPEDVGQFTLATAIVVPVYWFFNLGLRCNQSTDVRGQFTFQEFLTLRLLTTSIGFLLIVVFVVLFSTEGGRLILLIVGASKGVETFSDLFYGTFQRAHKISFVARSLALRGLGSAAAFGIVLWVGFSPVWAFAGHLAVWIFVALFVDYFPARRLSGVGESEMSVRWSRIWWLAKSSIPLGISGCLSGFTASIPRFVVGHSLGSVVLGQFAVTSYAMQASSMMVAAISESISARLAYLANSGNTRAFSAVLSKFLRVIFVAGISLTVVCWVVGDELILFVFGPAYPHLGGLLAITAAASALQSGVNILQTGIVARRQFKLHAFLRTGMVGTMLITTLLGLSLGGVKGVAVGMGAAFLIQLGLLSYFLLRPPSIKSQTT